jgi:hypothetical protein
VLGEGTHHHPEQDACQHSWNPPSDFGSLSTHVVIIRQRQPPCRVLSPRRYRYHQQQYLHKNPNGYRCHSNTGVPFPTDQL